MVGDEVIIQLLKILVIFPAIIDILGVEERLFEVQINASYFGYGVEDTISDLICKVEKLE